MAKPTTNTPAFSLRDGAVKLTCWENKAGDKTFHSIDVVRSYQDDKEKWLEPTSFSVADVLKVSALTQEAYAKIRELRYP